MHRRGSSSLIGHRARGFSNVRMFVIRGNASRRDKRSGSRSEPAAADGRGYHLAVDAAAVLRSAEDRAIGL